MSKCVVCNSNAQVDNVSNIHEFKVICPSCGEFTITETALSIIPKDAYPNWREKLQGWIRSNQGALITELTIKSIF